MNILKNKQLHSIILKYCLLILASISYAERLDGISIQLKILSTTNVMVFSRNIDDDEFNLIPNNIPQPGFGIMYKHNYGLNISPSFYGTDQDLADRPKTKFFDIQSFYYGSRFGADILYQYYRGFYVDGSNIQDVESNHPNLKTSATSLNIYYLFNSEKESLYRMTDPSRKKNSEYFSPWFSTLHKEK